MFDNGGKDRIKSFAIVIISDERFDQIVGFLFNNSKIPVGKKWNRFWIFLSTRLKRIKSNFNSSTFRINFSCSWERGWASWPRVTRLTLLSWIQSPEFSGLNLSPERIGDLGVRSFTDSDTTSTWRPEGSKRRSSSSIRSSFSN